MKNFYKNLTEVYFKEMNKELIFNQSIFKSKLQAKEKAKNTIPPL